MSTATRRRARPTRKFPLGVLLVVLFMFVAWSLRVAFLGYDALSDLTLAGVANEAVRAVIFVGPVLLYLRYVEHARATRLLRLVAPSRDALWVLPLAGAAFVAWYLLLDRVIGDRGMADVAFAVVLFAVLSPTTLIEEVYFRGFLLNKLWQAMGFWRANVASSALFALTRPPRGRARSAGGPVRGRSHDGRRKPYGGTARRARYAGDRWPPGIGVAGRGSGHTRGDARPMPRRFRPTWPPRPRRQARV